MPLCQEGGKLAECLPSREVDTVSPPGGKKWGYVVTVRIATELEEEVCISCGILFAIPESYKRWLRETHKTFYCPNGHNMYFPAETEAERLQRQLRDARESNNELNEANYKLNRQLDGALDSLNKLHKRANAGVCPHCHRHFANVERHIQSKHKV